MSKKQHEHHHSKKFGRVDLDSQRIRYHGRLYEWKGGGEDYLHHRRWYRISEHRLRRNGVRVRWKPEDEREEYDRRDFRHQHGIDWAEIRYRLKDSDERIKRLERLLERAEAKEERRERIIERAVKKEEGLREKKRREQAVREEAERERVKAVQKVVLSDAPSESEQPREVEPIQRDKHGVRLYSNDSVHFFTMGVYKSRNHPGACTVSLFVAGKPYWYTLEPPAMQALFREVARGLSVDDLHRLIGNLQPK